MTTGFLYLATLGIISAAALMCVRDRSPAVEFLVLLCILDACVAMSCAAIARSF